MNVVGDIPEAQGLREPRCMLPAPLSVSTTEAVLVLQDINGEQCQTRETIWGKLLRPASASIAGGSP